MSRFDFLYKRAASPLTEEILSGSAADMMSLLASGKDPKEISNRINHLAGIKGSLAGYFGGFEESDIRRLNKDRGSRTRLFETTLPGVQKYRAAQRDRAVALRMLKKLKQKKYREAHAHPYANIVSEQLGPTTSVLSSAAVGGLLGGLKGHLSSGHAEGNEIAAGALLGAGLGLGANFIGKATGLLRKRRTDEEQLKRESRIRALAKYIIPGLGVHDMYARREKSRDYIRD